MLVDFLNFLKRSLLDFRVWVLFLVLQVPALRVIFKYFPVPQVSIPLYLISTFIFYATVLHANWFYHFSAHILDNGWTTLLLLVLLAVIAFYVYPIADGLKARMRGSDQDDAIIDCGLKLASGSNPYETVTYFGNPPSPGPGWIILLLPLVISGTYFLLTPLFMAGTACLIKLTSHSFYKANMFILLLMSSIAFWELMIVGSDLLSIGSLFLICIGVLYYNKSSFRWETVALVAIALTTRIIFYYLIPVFGIFLWQRDHRIAIKFVVASSVLTAFIHLIFYIWNPHIYTPLHLLSKGRGLMGKWLIPLLCITCGMVALYMIAKVNNQFNSWVFFLWLCIATPLAFVSLGDLVFRSYNFAAWEGANYLAVSMPVYLAYMCFNLPHYPSVSY